MRRKGFTTIEIVVVLLVIGVIFAMLAAGVQRYIDAARRAEAIIDVGAMSKAIKSYEKVNGALPATLAAVTLNGTTLDAKLDPWGFAYEYVNLVTATGNGSARKDKKLAPLNSDFDLYSKGPDGVTQASLGHANSRDDIVRARDGGFIGPAEEFDP